MEIPQIVVLAFSDRERFKFSFGDEIKSFLLSCRQADLITKWFHPLKMDLFRPKDGFNRKENAFVIRQKRFLFWWGWRGSKIGHRSSALLALTRCARRTCHDFPGRTNASLARLLIRPSSPFEQNQNKKQTSLVCFLFWWNYLVLTPTISKKFRNIRSPNLGWIQQRSEMKTRLPPTKTA